MKKIEIKELIFLFKELPDFKDCEISLYKKEDNKLVESKAITPKPIDIKNFVIFYNYLSGVQIKVRNATDMIFDVNVEDFVEGYFIKKKGKEKINERLTIPFSGGTKNCL